MTDDAPQFGALAPDRFQEAARRLSARLPANYFGRKGASLLLGPAGGRARRPFDVEVFGGSRARLHPFDNISEKRVYMSPQLWEAEERAHLARLIAASPHEDFWFVDVGANAGLYTLFALARARDAGRRLHALCVEPDPVMGARLAFNLRASDAESNVVVAACAVGAAEGVLRFAPNARSRGQSRIDDAGPAEVRAKPLRDLIDALHAPRIDALKIDIEGAELDVLETYFSVDGALAPSLVLAERSHEKQPGALRRTLVEAGYSVEEVGMRSLVARRNQTSG